MRGVTEVERERTDWAEERTLLASERTVSGWTRTGLTAVIGGLGIAHLPEPRGRPAMTRAMEAIFVLSGRLAIGLNLVPWLDQKGNSRLMQMKTHLRHFERYGPCPPDC